MLMGSYQNSIDAKNRVIIPAKYRGDLGENCVLSMGLDNCLVLYPQRIWDARMEKLMNELPKSDPRARSYIRFLSQDMEELKDAIRRDAHDLVPKHITKEDIFASINYNIHLEYGIGSSKSYFR